MSDEIQADGAIARQDLYGTKMEPTYGGVLSFMRRKYTKDLDGVDVAVTSVPFDLGTSHRSGARMGPRTIRENSTNLCWGIVDHWGFDPFESLAVVDYGDCSFNPTFPNEVPKAIEEHTRTILDSDVYALTLGGDHFITYPILKAYAEKYQPLSLLHFDAHADTVETEPEAIYHGSMFYHAAKQKLVVSGQSVQIGIRTHADLDLGYNVIKSSTVHTQPLQDTINHIRDCLGNNPVYLSFDIDGLDPAYAPGTGTPEVGGLTTFQVQAIMCGLKGINLVGADLVEVAPIYDPTHITGHAAANIAQDMLCLFAAR